jgi:hypothetical protein
MKNIHSKIFDNNKITNKIEMGNIVGGTDTAGGSDVTYTDTKTTNKDPKTGKVTTSWDVGLPKLIDVVTTSSTIDMPKPKDSTSTNLFYVI